MKIQNFCRFEFTLPFLYLQSNASIQESTITYPCNLPVWAQKTQLLPQKAHSLKCFVAPNLTAVTLSASSFSISLSYMLLETTWNVSLPSFFIDSIGSKDYSWSTSEYSRITATSACIWDKTTSNISLLVLSQEDIPTVFHEHCFITKQNPLTHQPQAG